MAARLNKRHQDMVKDKIRASQLITRLTNHALGKLKKPMDQSQVTAACRLLDKVLGNAPAQVELSGPNGGPITHEDASPARPRVSPQEWLLAHGVDLQEIADVGPATRPSDQRAAG